MSNEVDALAAFIRQIDGNNRMGAGTLAENICEWLAAAPKADVQEPVQEPARNPDVLALNAAREIMALVYGPTPLGGSPQLLAQIQCVVSEAIVYAAPQPVSDDVAKALKTAANRMQRLALEVDGDWRGYATEWAEEALAAYKEQQ